VFEAFRLSGSIIFDSGNAINQLRNFNNAVEKMSKKLKDAGSAVKNAGSAMTKFITLPVLAGIGAAIKGASDMNETVSKTGVVFGNGAKEVLKWSDTTLKKIGLAKGTALDMAAVYGDMGTAMGLNTDEAKKMSMGLVELTGDMASFKNIRPDEIHIALTSAYTGETESLKRLGIVMTQTNLEEYARSQGIKKSIKQMTQAEKIQLRYNYIMDSAKNSIGDFERTQDSAANQIRIFTEGIKEGSAKIGELFLPYFTKAVNFVNKLLDSLKSLNPGIQKFIIIIALVAAGIGPLVMIAGSLIGALGTIAGVVSAVGLPVIGLIAGIAGLIAVITPLIIKSGILEPIINKIKKAFSGLKEKLGIFFDMLDDGVPFLEALTWSLWDLFGRNEKLGVFFDMLEDGVPFIEALSWSIKDLMKSNSKFKNFIDFFVAGFNNVKKILTLVIPIIIDLAKNYLKTLISVFGFLSNIIKDVGGTIFPVLKNAMVEAMPVIMDLIKAIHEFAVVWLAKFRDGIKAVQIIWNQVWPKLAPVVTSIFNIIKSVVIAALDIIKNIFKIFTGILKGDWGKVWNGILGILAAVGKLIVNLVVNIFNIIKHSIGTALKAAKNSVSSELNKIKSNFTIIFNGIKGIVKSVINWIADKIGWIGNKINGLKEKASGIGKSVSDFGGWINPFDNFAEGTNSAPGGWSWVGEKGPELRYISKGTKIVPHTKSMSMAGGVTLVVNNPNVFQTNDAVKYIYKPFVEYLQRAGVRSF
jgi:phage-related protein